MTSDPKPVGGLAGRVQRGIGWMIASQGAMQVSALATSIVIARSMSPHDVGLASEAIVFATLGIVIVDLGLGPVVIQRAEVSDADLSTVFWTGIGIGVLMTLIGIALSGPIAQIYGQPQVQGLFAVLSFTFVIVAPGVVQGGLLIRDLHFRSLELRTIAATVSSCTVAMVLAVLGAGPWAIVAQTLTMGSVSTVLLWRSSTWRPQWIFSVESLRSFAGYATHLLGAQLMRWANVNVDNFLVGRVLGAAPLGDYSLAFGIALTPVSRVAGPIGQVFFPAFARLGDRERIAEVWLRAVRLLAFVTVPAMLGLVVVAPDLVVAVFGERWRAAGPVMQILAGVALLQSLTAMHDGVLQALAETRLLVRFTTVLSALTIAGIAAGLPWGLRGVAWGYLIVSLILQPVYMWLTGRTVGVSPIRWLRSIAGTLQAGAAMLVVALVAQHLLVAADVATGLRLAVVIALGAVVYLPIGAWRVPEIKLEVAELRARRRNGL
jgi:O-antigen/teichoic acid export membrane protein